MAYKFNPFTGTLDEVGAGGSASAAGSDTQIQFNSSGAFAGSADLTWDDTGKELGVGGDINLDDGGTYTTTLQLITPTANRTISFPDATGTVALVGGSSGQLVYNNAGANGGVPASAVGATGDITLSLNGAASTPPLKLTGTWFTGGTSTTTKPQFLIEPTGTTSTAWSTSGTGLGVNAPSGFTGNLLDLQVDGTSKAKINNNGTLVVTGGIILPQGLSSSYAIVGANNAQVDIGSLGNFRFTGASSTDIFSLLFTKGAQLRNTFTYAWSSTSNSQSIADTALARDQAGVVAITDGSTGTGYLKQTPVAVSALPAAATVGAGTRGFVSDSTVAASGNFGATVTGGGSNNVPVFSDGTNWLIG